MRILLSERNVFVTRYNVHFVNENREVSHRDVPFNDFELRKWIEAISQ